MPGKYIVGHAISPQNKQNCTLKQLMLGHGTQEAKDSAGPALLPQNKGNFTVKQPMSEYAKHRYDVKYTARFIILPSSQQLGRAACFCQAHSGACQAAGFLWSHCITSTYFGTVRNSMQSRQLSRHGAKRTACFFALEHPPRIGHVIQLHAKAILHRSFPTCFASTRGYYMLWNMPNCGE